METIKRRATDFPITRHLGAISPYFKILQQPRLPASHIVNTAVYLFRHGIIHVSEHDYRHSIEPFLKKVFDSQQLRIPFVKDTMGFLSTYSTWITDDDIGTVSTEGLEQTREMGRTFQARYQAWLGSPGAKSMTVWADSADRCKLSAKAFAEGFSEHLDMPSVKTSTTVNVTVLDANKSKVPCDNLCWHKTFPEIDQTLGQFEADHICSVYTEPILLRLRPFFSGAFNLSPQDVYAMQVLCAYDLVAGKESPFSPLFEKKDWLGFEYLRDLKYHFSEGYGAPHSGEYAIPWLEQTINTLTSPTEEVRNTDTIPLWIGFTHREEVLYLAVLLGLGWDGPGKLSPETVRTKRHWRVTRIAPYLGHIGVESFRGPSGLSRLRIIQNGEVVAGFHGQLEQDEDGSYNIEEVQQWMRFRVAVWTEFKGDMKLRFFGPSKDD